MRVIAQMKAHFFDAKAYISIIVLLATFKILCDSNCIQNGGAMRVLRHRVTETLANALNSCTCVMDKSSPTSTSVRTVDS